MSSLSRLSAGEWTSGQDGQGIARLTSPRPGANQRGPRQGRHHLPEPHSSAMVATAEITADMRPADLLFVLENLRFKRQDLLVPLLLIATRATISRSRCSCSR